VVVEHVPQAVPLVQGLEVTPGLEAAVAAGLGEAAAALVVPALDAAVEAIAAVTAAAAASVTVVVPQATDPLSDPSGGPGAPDRLADAVRGHGAAAVWARHRLAGIVLVDDLRAAAEALQAHPPVRAAVTVAGEYVSPDTLRAGTGAGGDALRLRAELADAADRSSTVRACLESARSETDRQRARVEADRAALAQAEDRLTEASAACAVAAQHRAAAVARREAAAGEVSRLHHAVQEVGSRQAGLVAEVDRARAALAEAVARCAQAESEAMAGGSDTPSVLADRVVRTRDAEHEARVTSRGLEERWAAARRRAETAVAAAAAARELAALAEVEGRRRRQSRATAAAVRQAAAQAVVVAQRVREVAGAAEAAHQAEHEAVVARHSTAGRQVERLAGERARLIQLRHAEEIARTGRQLRLDALAATALEEYGYSVDDLVEQFGPDVPVPVGGQDQASDDDEQPAVTDAEPPLPEGPPGEDPGTATPRTEPFERDRQVRRLRAAERALTALGSINPLATEEYAALEERHRFLLQQQQDLSDSKRDLLAIIRDVDQKIDTVVAEAFADTARHFAGLVPRLFPGGTGRLVLTDPEDLVTSGIEVEARPAGKSVKRLSLLSGGERTLVALAFLVALFRARPSPFYVLDEIEAALDETNLRRLLVLVDELRSTSQLVLVTHQRPTMEAADALYGVTMTEGVSRVVGRRLRERAA
jgi:chromosome segregation protein